MSLPSVIGIARIAIGAPQVASGQADENTGQSGVKGFALNTVKYFIDSEWHKNPYTGVRT